MLAFVAIFGLIAVGGAWLTLRGFFPKRQGETPFCRKCRYTKNVPVQAPMCISRRIARVLNDAPTRRVDAEARR